MRPGRRTAALVGVAAIAAASAAAQPPSSWPTALPLALDRAAATLKAGGLVAAEVRAGSVRYLEAGHPEPRPGIPPERLVFEIGSVTKVFTGLLLAQAVVENRVRLTDTLGQWLPESVPLDPKVAAITLEELATHTSGLPALAGRSRAEDYRSGLRLGDFYAFLSSFHPAAPPPAPPLYSNLGPSLVGLVLERAYGESYDDLVREKIDRPIGLADTSVELSPEQASRFARPHDGGRLLRPWRLPVFAGAVGLHSTAADLVRLSLALMAPADPSIRPAWEIARRPWTDFPAYGGQAGLGVLILQRNGDTVYWHGGTTAGSHSHLQWSSRLRRALVVLENNGSPEAMNLVVTFYQIRPDAAP
jgi:CubicO group peptidase (beta-lactamase class C family)